MKVFCDLAIQTIRHINLKVSTAIKRKNWVSHSQLSHQPMSHYWPIQGFAHREWVGHWRNRPMAGTIVAGCYEQPSHIYTVFRQRFIDDTKLRVLFKWLLLLMRRKARQIEWFRWHSSANFCNEISKNDCSHFRDAINRSKRDQRKEWHFLIMKNLIRSWLQIFFFNKSSWTWGKESL